jgi:hypothetical protein
MPRDLVRAREDARADLMRVRHRLSKLLLRQGIVYSGGTPWTCVHEEWLRRHRFAEAGGWSQYFFEQVLELLLLCAGQASKALIEFAR